MSIQAVCLKVRMRWWLVLYLRSVATWARLFNVEPDWEKVERMVVRGLVIEAVR